MLSAARARRQRSGSPEADRLAPICRVCDSSRARQAGRQIDPFESGGTPMSERTRRALPSPALVIACIALVVSLSGTAVAAGIVANARHANRADLAARALNSD